MFTENKAYVAQGTLDFKQFLVQASCLERDGNSCSSENKENYY